MALSSTTLSAACSATDTQISVTSATGFPALNVSAASQLVIVDGESMYTVNGVCQAATGVIKVRSRGADGTKAIAHDILAPVVTSASASDFPALGMGNMTAFPLSTDQLVNVGQNGTIAVPVQNTTIMLTKATALASTTLAAPSQASDGVRLTITSQTAAAHVITATSLFGDGVSGSPHSTATFAAYIGASLTLVAANGVWNVVSSVGVTIT